MNRANDWLRYSKYSDNIYTQKQLSDNNLSICKITSIVNQMNYTIELNSHLYELQCDLWDISSLQPEQFVGKAQLIIGSGFETNVISLILQSIHQYKFQRSLLKYIRIVDKLLKHKTFMSPINNMIIEIFYETFVSFWNQKWVNEIQELKMLRKLWVLQVHPTIMARMRQCILVATNCDVDGGFKPEAIKMIRNIYQKRYGMTPDQVKINLPYEGRRDKQNMKLNQQVSQSKQTKQFRETRQSKQLKQFPETKQSKRSPETQAYDDFDFHKRSHPSADYVQRSQYYEEGPRKMINSNTFSYGVPVNNTINTMRNINNLNTIYSFNPMYTEPLIASFAQSPSNMYPYQSERQMEMNQKLQAQKYANIEKKEVLMHYQPSKLKYQEILQKIQNQVRYQCKTCGQFLQTEQCYDQHLHSHFLQNRKAYQLRSKKQKISNSRAFNSSEQQWIEQSQKVIQLNRFCVPSQREDTHLFKSQYICPLCGNQLTEEFSDSKEVYHSEVWIFKRSVKVQINGKQGIAHKACLDQFYESD